MREEERERNVERKIKREEREGKRRRDWREGGKTERQKRREEK